MSANVAVPGEPSPPPPARRWRRVRAWLTPWNILTVAILLWAAPRLLPHLGAVVGIRSGPDDRPAFRVTALDGAVLSDSALRGKVVLVNFWATWCIPCRVEMPALDRMHQRHAAAGFVVVGLAVDRVSTAQVREFAEDRGVVYPIAHVDAAAERTFGGVRGYPTSFLLDRTGRIRHTVIGPVAPLSLEPAVRRLLAEP